MNYKSLENYKETAILFSKEFASEVQKIYDDLKTMFPEKEVYLVNAHDVICPFKHDKYESYVIVGIECPLHHFSNSILFYKKLEFSEKLKFSILNHNGPVMIDSIYKTPEIIECLELKNSRVLQIDDNSKESELKNSSEILVITLSQQILDYYVYNYENVISYSENLVIKDRIKYLMKENINGNKVNEKRIFGIVFTNRSFEDVADNLCRRLNERARAYKILLKDVSYERLISVDNIDCIVLIDCPVFEHNISVHIPIISPFSVECGLSEEWKSEYSRNLVKECESKELVVQSQVAQLMEAREFKGVAYRSENEDYEIGEGRRGLAAQYNHELH